LTLPFPLLLKTTLFLFQAVPAVSVRTAVGTTLAHVLTVTMTMTLARAFSMVLAMPLVIAAPRIGTSLTLCCTPGPLRVRIISSFLTHMAGRHPAMISVLTILLPAPSRHHSAAIA
jgi:hypothetical protein